VADPRRSPEGAVQNLTTELNATLGQTVTSYPLVAKVKRPVAHITFQGDRAVPLGNDRGLHVILDLYLGEWDDQRGQYRNHVIKANFSYLELPDRASDPIVEYHLHELTLAAERYLVPHLHFRRNHPDGLGHVFIGRPCLEDLLEFLVLEEEIPLIPHQRPRGGPALTDDELRQRAIIRLHDGRRLFHERFKTWGGFLAVADLPSEVQRYVMP
jgi:hypothetical protein